MICEDIMIYVDNMVYRKQVIYICIWANGYSCSKLNATRDKALTTCPLTYHIIALDNIYLFTNKQVYIG